MTNDPKYLQFQVRLFWWTIIALVVASFIVPKGQDVLWINGHYSAFADRFFQTITRLGEGWIFIPVLIISLFIRYSLSLAVTFMAALHGIICTLVKKSLPVEAFLRPSEVLKSEALHYVPGEVLHQFLSFPSGHTATVFCFAVLAALLVRHRLASIVLLSLALLVGYSRIYLLQHFLLDVTAGALIGVASAFFSLYLFDRIQLPSWSQLSLTWGKRQAN
jgi:membrane-associated phospholipid phosphatase